MSENIKNSGKKPVVAAIYVRQSQEHLEGIDRQIALCKKLCKANGWDVYRIYQDNDVSAFKNRGKGTAWAQMLSDIVEEGIDTVVATNMDRLLRRVVDLDPLTKTGVNVVTVDGELTLSSAEGQFRATIGASVAQFETKRKSERQIRANDAKSARGVPVPSRRRFGYETDGCTPRPNEAKEVKRLFEEFVEGASLRSLALDMQTRKVDPGGGKGWPIGRIRGILNNVFYGGEIIHRGVISESDIVEPIVPRELARDARAILADPIRRTSPGGSITHLLTGIAVCGVCGKTMHHMTDYKCRAALNHVQIKKNKIEPLVLWEVYKWASENAEPSSEKTDSAEVRTLMIVSKEILDKILEQQEIATWPGSDKSSIKATVARLGKERDEVETKIEKLRSKNASHSILRKVRLAWNAPIEAKGFSNWQAAMRDSASLMGWEIDESELTPDRFEQKVRIERQIDEWPKFWGSLPLDQRREVVKGVLKITVNKGRDLDRIDIEHI